MSARSFFKLNKTHTLLFSHRLPLIQSRKGEACFLFVSLSSPFHIWINRRRKREIGWRERLFPYFSCLLFLFFVSFTCNERSGSTKWTKRRRKKGPIFYFNWLFSCFILPLQKSQLKQKLDEKWSVVRVSSLCLCSFELIQWKRD